MTGKDKALYLSARNGGKCETITPCPSSFFFGSGISLAKCIDESFFSIFKKVKINNGKFHNNAFYFHKNRTLWSREDDLVLKKMVEEGKSFYDVSDVLGRSVDSVKVRLYSAKFREKYEKIKKKNKEQRISLLPKKKEEKKTSYSAYGL